MFQLAQKNSIPYLQSTVFAECDFLTHAFCTRQGGASREDYKSLNMSFREGDEEFRVLQNWSKLAEAFAIPLEQFLVLNQVHGDGIFVIKPQGSYFSSRDELNYDAIVTSRTNLAICIKTADCVPVFIVDQGEKSHCGGARGLEGHSIGYQRQSHPVDATSIRLTAAGYSGGHRAVHRPLLL